MDLRVWEDHEAGSDTEFRPTTAGEGAAGIGTRLDELRHRYSRLAGEALLRILIEQEFPGRLAVVSSFGSESAALLALVAEIDQRVPVLFLDTGKLYGETLRYRDRLIAALRLSDVRTLHPRAEDLAADDADSMLWLADPDRCCALRKVAPLASALHGFEAWVSGRKRCSRRMGPAGSRSTHLPAGRALRSKPCSQPVICRGTRWWPMAICRSDA
jgi:hypothetical protein